MRRRMSRDGMVVVVIDHKGRAQVTGIGLPLDEDYAEFVTEAESDVVTAVSRLKGGARKDREAVIEAGRLAARRAAQRWSGKKPQVKVLLTEG